MIHEAAQAVLRELVVLAITRGRFRIRKRSSTNYRLVLSIVVSQESRGIVDYLLFKVGGTTYARTSRRGLQILVWEVHDQDILDAVVKSIHDLQDDGLELSAQMSWELDLAWAFLQTPVLRGRMTPERRSANKEAMEERARLYELMREE